MRSPVGKRAALAIDAWLAGDDLDNTRSRPRALRRPALPRAAPRRRQAERRRPQAGRDLAGVAQDGRWTPRRRRAPRCRRCRSVKRICHLRRGREGPLGRRRPRPRRPAACSASARRTAPASCSAWASSTASPTTTSSCPGALVRQVEPAHEHPFIRRDMDRCIACGRCVRVCRDVAGPACYDFSGRGFAIRGRHALRRAPAAGRLHHLRALRDRLPDRRAHHERARAALVPQRRVALHHVPPVRRRLPGRRHQGDQRLRAGAGPLARARRAGFKAGRRAPHVRGLRRPHLVRRCSRVTDDPIVVAAATGCLEVATSIYPYSAWKSPWIHTAFENASATMSGVEAMYRSLKKQGKLEGKIKFVAFGGDGGTYDIGLQSLSGAMERGHDLLYICYDNGAYMNTGMQRCGATPLGAWTTTSPVGKAARARSSAARTSPHRRRAQPALRGAGLDQHDPRDQADKAARALATGAPRSSTCSRRARAAGAPRRRAVGSPARRADRLLAAVRGRGRRSTSSPTGRARSSRSTPGSRSRVASPTSSSPGNEEQLENLQEWVDHEWEQASCASATSPPRPCGRPRRSAACSLPAVK